MGSAVSRAVLMCHAPIVVPAVGQGYARHCAATTSAMRAAARRLLDDAPDAVVIVSPHTPRRSGSWGVVDQAELVGSFASFGVPEARVGLPVAVEAARAIRAEAADLGVATHPLSIGDLDHGAVVPLWFVQEAGWSGPTVLIALPWEPDDAEALGRAIASAARRSGQRWAFLASGDMSHRLAPGAPSGFHPRAKHFDDQFASAVARGDLRAAVAVDPELRELAAEDVVVAVTIAAAAVGWDGTGSERLGYEGPFGVGYCEAVLHAS